MMHRLPVLLTIAGLALLMTTLTALADTIDEQARAIGKELQCPVCNGQTVADSPSDLAGQMRVVIHQKLEAGESHAAIVSYFVERYGDSVLIEPPRRGFALAVWLGPILGLLAGAAGLALLVKQWLRPRWSSQIVTEPHRNGVVSSPLGDDASARVRAELERYREAS
ncbi:MAG: cytochrome c-type biogenesis protein CcmH [Chloroflexi bacterium]|nr:cytochrome c-type biogenesis protein CcmH [Chloroflexota bacterium]